MKWNKITILAKKDIKEFLSSKMILVPIITAQLVTCLVMPVIIMLIGFNADAGTLKVFEMIGQSLVPLYKVPPIFTSFIEKLLYIFVNFTILPLLMILPMTGTSAIAANSFVGEKERKTLETLLYTPINNKELVMAKILSSLIPAFIISILEIIVYFAVTNLISHIYIGTFILFEPLWFVTVLLLSFSISFFGLSVTMIVSIKAKSYVEVQQISGIRFNVWSGGWFYTF